MLSLKQYHILEQMHIPLWLERPRSALQYHSNHMLLGAPCLVIVEKFNNKLQEYPLFTGMLKVLDIAFEKLGIAWYTGGDINQKILLQLSPKTLLIMGHTIAAQVSKGNMACTIPCIAVPHPVEILQKPSLKREAFESLKILKKIIYHG